MKYTEYDDLYFDILNITAGPDDDPGFSSLPESARCLHFVALFDMEILNGGLQQFFVNCGVPYALHISKSLRTVGLPEMADLYDAFTTGHGIDVSSLSEFSAAINDFDAQSALYPFDEFDDAYVNLWEKCNFQKIMLEYANAHPEAFQ